MKRREFITHFGGAAVAAAWPFAARAQQAMPLVGFMHSGSQVENAKRLAAFHKGLGGAGFVEGKNLAIAYRWGNGRDDRMPEFAADLVSQKCNVLVTASGTAATRAAKAATSTIPIVFATGGDPVALGLVPSLSRPGGNVTGATSLNLDVAAKRLGVLRELVGQGRRYFAVVNPASPLAEFHTKDIASAAAALGIHVDVLHARADGDIDQAFASLPKQSGNVMVFSPDPFFYSRREKLAALATRHAVPAIFDVREYVEAGGLASYGSDFLDVMQLAGDYAGRILKGEKPADLPVVQSAKFELVLNLKTAKALGLTVPPTLLALADEVIE